MCFGIRLVTVPLQTENDQQKKRVTNSPFFIAARKFSIQTNHTLLINCNHKWYKTFTCMLHRIVLKWSAWAKIVGCCQLTNKWHVSYIHHNHLIDKLKSQSTLTAPESTHRPVSRMLSREIDICWKLLTKSYFRALSSTA